MKIEYILSKIKEAELEYDIAYKKYEATMDYLIKKMNAINKKPSK